MMRRGELDSEIVGSNMEVLYEEREEAMIDYTMTLTGVPCSNNVDD